MKMFAKIKDFFRAPPRLPLSGTESATVADLSQHDGSSDAAKGSDSFAFELSHRALLGDLAGIVELIGNGADPKAHESRALEWAASAGRVECVRFLIPLSCPKANESYALCQAARKGHAECVSLLIPVSDPRAFDSGALSEAARYGHAECVKLLIPVADPKVSLALMMASHNGHIECIRLLIPVSNATEAVFAALGSRDAECVRVLVSSLASLALDPHPFHLAIEFGHAQAAALMIAREPSLASLLDLNESIERAAKNGHRELAEILLSLAEKVEIALAAPAAPAASKQISAVARL